jgi:hypothetical protein
VGEKKIPPPLVDKPKLIEGRRKAAQIIAERIETPAELKPLALALSTSLGTPEKPAETIQQAQKALTKGEAEKTKDENAQQKFHTEFQGKTVENTGFDLFPLGGGVGLVALVALVALGIFCPGFLTAAFFVIKRLRATLGTIVNSIESHEQTAPAEMAALKAKIQSNMVDPIKKKLIKSLKREY